MLVLTRKPGERVAIEVGDILVWATIVDVRPDGAVKVGLDGPPEARFDREEIRAARLKGVTRGIPHPDRRAS